MYRQRNTRSFLAAFLLASAHLTSASTPTNPSHPECLHARGRELAASASCGDDGSITYCFSQIPLDTSPEHLIPSVEECLLNAGCSATEAPIEAFWALRRCDKPPSPADLRRHAAGITLAARQDATPAPGAAATTDPNASPSHCFTNTDVAYTSCPVQSTGPDAGKTLRKGCVPTTQPSPVCVEGLICIFDSQGNPSCMRKHNNLGIAGTIIAIFFAVAVAAAIFGVCFMCCRERRQHKRMERAAEAANIAREAKNSAMLASKKPSAGAMAASHREGDGDVGQPLMGAVGGGSGHGGLDHSPLPPLPQQYGGAGQDGHNPFADSGHDSHPLR